LKHVVPFEQHHVSDLEVWKTLMCHPVLDGPHADPTIKRDFTFPPEGVLAKSIIVVFHA
jgi:hypothetical protein